MRWAPRGCLLKLVVTRNVFQSSWRLYMNSRIWGVPDEFPWRWVATRGNTHSLPSKSDNWSFTFLVSKFMKRNTGLTIRKLKGLIAQDLWAYFVRPLRSPENQNVEPQSSHHSSSSIQQRNEFEKLSFRCFGNVHWRKKQLPNLCSLMLCIR